MIDTHTTLSLAVLVIAAMGFGFSLGRAMSPQQPSAGAPQIPHEVLHKLLEQLDECAGQIGNMQQDLEEQLEANAEMRGHISELRAALERESRERGASITELARVLQGHNAILKATQGGGLRQQGGQNDPPTTCGNNTPTLFTKKMSGANDMENSYDGKRKRVSFGHPSEHPQSAREIASDLEHKARRIRAKAIISGDEGRE